MIWSPTRILRDLGGGLLHACLGPCLVEMHPAALEGLEPCRDVEPRHVPDHGTGKALLEAAGQTRASMPVLKFALVRAISKHHRAVCLHELLRHTLGKLLEIFQLVGR